MPDYAQQVKVMGVFLYSKYTFGHIPARRPPVEETTSFLNSLLASHGPNYLEKLFGSKARHRLRELGGVNQVAIALSGKKKQNIKSLLKNTGF